MSFLLDTDTCSTYLKRPRGMTHRFIQHSGRLFVPTIVLAELYTWAYRRSIPSPVLAAINTDLLPQVAELTFDRACAEEWGKVRAGLLGKGLQIAVIALVHNLILVTHNTADYRHVPGLRLDDWVQP